MVGKSWTLMGSMEALGEMNKAEGGGVKDHQGPSLVLTLAHYVQSIVKIISITLHALFPPQGVREFIREA